MWPLFIHGSVGTGKTRFALLVHDWYGGRYMDFSELADEFTLLRKGELADKRWWTAPPVTMHEWRKRVRDERLFILDDIGIRDSTDAVREALTMVLNEREERPAVYVSNLSPSKLVEVFDERVASRLCQGTVVKVEGEDRRTSKVPMRR